MRGPDELDVIRDALAMVEAAHREDVEGCRVLIANCNTRLVATFLARMCCDLIESVDDHPAETLRVLRAWHTEGGG